MTSAADRDAIFLISDGEKLSRVSLAPYDSEDLLQKLIADYPEVLAGEQIDPGAPVRWLLVRREAGVPKAEDGYDHFAVDHLLLDQNAVPTFVEVKRSSDTRIRRELVGQMLDYAANAQRYWPADRIREMAAEAYGGEDLRRLITALTDAAPDLVETSTERFWTQVDENLRNGHVRLLFVADALPPELRRIIEFLNEQMPRVQVLGLELRQYVGEGVRALVPRLVGQTELVRQEKSTTSTAKIDRDQFLAACPAPIRSLVAQIIDTVTSRGLSVTWGSALGAIRAAKQGGKFLTLAYLYPPSSNQPAPRLSPYLEYLTPEEAEEFRKRLEQAAPFQSSGKLSMHLPLRLETKAEAERALDVILDFAARIGSTSVAG